MAAAVAGLSLKVKLAGMGVAAAANLRGIGAGGRGGKETACGACALTPPGTPARGL